MPETVYENHLKGEYPVENGDESLMITSSSCYRMKEETLSLIEHLPARGNRGTYLEALSSMGVNKGEAIFERLKTIGVLRGEIKKNRGFEILKKITMPDFILLSSFMQEKVLKFLRLKPSKEWLEKNPGAVFFFSAAGTLLSLLISFTGFYPLLNGISAGKPSAISLMVLIYSGSLLHELGHSFMAATSGIGLRPIGFSVYLFYPVFYTNVSGMEKLSIREKAAIDCGGFFVQSLYLFSLLALWTMTRNRLFLEAVRWISLIVAFNLNPFLRTDAYWFYKDLKKNFENNDIFSSFHRVYLAAYLGFSVYLFFYVYDRIEYLWSLVLFGFHEPKFLLHDGYKIVLGVYLIIMFFMGGLHRIKEARQEWLELKKQGN